MLASSIVCRSAEEIHGGKMSWRSGMTGRQDRCNMKFGTGRRPPGSIAIYLCQCHRSHRLVDMDVKSMPPARLPLEPASRDGEPAVNWRTIIGWRRSARVHCRSTPMSPRHAARGVSEIPPNCRPILYRHGRPRRIIGSQDALSVDAPRRFAVSMK